MRVDYIRWRKNHFCFANHAYILDPACKANLLRCDARVQMTNTLVTNPRRREWYLVLRVNRDNLIQDTMSQLQLKDSTELKKPLKVQFIGEDGIDEGGVRKEFFQLIIEQLFDPKFGMFKYMEETRMYWFCEHSLESTQEFELIGIILGLAIYNSVLLGVRFPYIVYKKLMKQQLGFKDFMSVFPEMGKGLRQLLEFEGDVESTILPQFYCQSQSFW
eukprot:TRINITY_DN2561_c0_g1_i1.p1 TRINITY_DN2561_c0_g1~~TRINITY_DN2561_c0_g1_i1.p1  ORF type:complete len:217 (-),score=16.81 TRINITY_DN2561_c0_g1_i1:36-686(-)